MPGQTEGGGGRRVPNWYRQPADLRPVRRRTLAMQAADQIRRRITTGDLRRGQRLEAGRTLAAELGVSLPVVREAVAALSYLGLLEVRHGVGTFVVRRPRAARLTRVDRRHARRAEVHRVRATLAQDAARMAARRTTRRRIQELHVTLYERERAVHEGDPAYFTRADLEFHRAVAQASRNTLGVAIERLAGAALWSDLAGRAQVLALDRHLRELHSDLVAAIESGRPTAAASIAQAIALREHRTDAESEPIDSPALR